VTTAKIGLDEVLTELAAEPRRDRGRGANSRRRRIILRASRARSFESGDRSLISRKTVEYHLHKVFTKLALSSRKEL
jgi:DNA-binding CsgD family transcriptional regulator